MRRFLFVIVMVSFCFGAQAQTNTGINFVRGLSWNQVLQKAKAVHKYIFVDCYATWCGPCKLMDAEVYPDPQVGAYMNDKFICVKVQIDRTKADSQEIRDWYQTAKMFYETYHIFALPTFLYFSPDGQPLHRVSGASSVQAFIQWAKDARDPGKQYYAILKNYQPGKLDTAELKGLALSERVTDPVLAGKLLLDYLGQRGWQALQQQHQAELINAFNSSKDIQRWVEQKLADAFSHNMLAQYGYKTLMIGFKKDSLVAAEAVAYITQMRATDLTDPENQPLIAAYSQKEAVKTKADEYLNSLSDEQLLSKSSLLFAGYFLPFEPPKGRIFDTFVRQSDAIDKITGQPGFAQSVIDATLFNQVYLDILRKAIETGGEPVWAILWDTMEKLAGQSNADRNLANFKYKFYSVMLNKAEGKHDEERFSWGKKLSPVIVAQNDGQPSAVNASDFNSAVTANNNSWTIFQYSMEPSELKKAANRIKPFLTKTLIASQCLDTYANLLYKLGRKKEALEWEKKALDKNPNDKDTQATYNKMQKGLPTWEILTTK